MFFAYIIFRFNELPYGPLKNITDEIQETLDVAHFKDHYIVSSFKDQRKLFEQAASQQIAAIPPVLVYTYEGTELYQQAKPIDGYDNMPLVVMKILLDHARKIIVCFMLFIIFFM